MIPWQIFFWQVSDICNKFVPQEGNIRLVKMPNVCEMLVFHPWLLKQANATATENNAITCSKWYKTHCRLRLLLSSFEMVSVTFGRGLDGFNLLLRRTIRRVKLQNGAKLSQRLVGLFLSGQDFSQR